MSLEEAARVALEAGAMQLGEGPRPQYILDAAQLVAFAELVRAGLGEGQKIPPLPY